MKDCEKWLERFSNDLSILKCCGMGVITEQLDRGDLNELIDLLTKLKSFYQYQEECECHHTH